MSIKPTETEAAEVQLFREIDTLNGQIDELQKYLASLRLQQIPEPTPQGMLTPKEIIEQAQKTVVLQKLFKDRAFLSISSRYAATPKICARVFYLT